MTIEIELEKLEILFEDDHIVAIDKPAGLPVHRDEFSSSRANACVQALRNQLGRRVYPAHRLDSATSGVLLFSKDKASLPSLMRQFELRSVQKTYKAIVRGWVMSPTTVNQSLKRMVRSGAPISPESEDVVYDDAITEFIPLKYLEVPWPNDRYTCSRYTFVQVIPLTGRYHQIRRHANYVAHPVVGDTKHGDGTHNRLWREQVNCHRLLLHAESLSFTHPVSGTTIDCVAAIPESMASGLENLNWVSG